MEKEERPPARRIERLYGSVALWLLTGLFVAIGVAAAGAQSPIAGRVAILLAAYRGATTSSDLRIVRAGIRSRDPQTARIAIRAIGRLERPAAIADLAPALRSPLPEVRAEAADAIAQAARGLNRTVSKHPSLSAASVLSLLTMRLDVEAEQNVRAMLCESLGRVPYSSAADVMRAEDAILGLLNRENSVMDRLGVAKGLEALARTSRPLRPLGARSVVSLRSLLGLRGDPPRVRRLALQALINAADGGVIADDLIVQGAGDQDMQVRRLAVRAAASARSEVGLAIVKQALRDPAPIVRSEALAAANAAVDAYSRSPEGARDEERAQPAAGRASMPPITVEEVAHLEAARARLTVRAIGTIELALFTAETPASVIRFVRLAEAGFYNGLTFDALTPEGIVQTRAAGAPADTSPLPDETSPWPHVRGSLGFAAARGTTDGRIAIQIADDPSLDHERAVFGQVLAGIDVVDRLREGDVIEKLDILLR